MGEVGAIGGGVAALMMVETGRGGRARHQRRRHRGRRQSRPRLRRQARRRLLRATIAAGARVGTTSPPAPAGGNNFLTSGLGAGGGVSIDGGGR